MILAINEQVYNCDINSEAYGELLSTYLTKENLLEENIMNQLMFGGTEEYNNRVALLDLGKMKSPVRIPCWMFRKYPDNPDFELDDIEKVAMAHVIHFTNAYCVTGYLECSGHIENWCKCTVHEAHKALKRLVKKKLIIQHIIPDDLCYGHKRNLGYTVNIEYVHKVLTLYKLDIWS